LFQSAFYPWYSFLSVVIGICYVSDGKHNTVNKSRSFSRISFEYYNSYPNFVICFAYSSSFVILMSY